MIPKTIHYCWLSDNPIPDEIQTYIDGWHQIMPDYKIKKWDRKAINLDEHPFAKEAFEHKKYAFAADYIRVYALYTEGGIYLDTDVQVLKSFDAFLKYDYFTSVENQLTQCNYKLLINRFIDREGNRLPGKNCYFMGIQAAIIASIPHHALMKELWSFYKKQHFVQSDGSFFHQVAPIVHARFAEKYGFKYIDRLQLLDSNMVVFPSSVFATKGIRESEETVALHCCKGSWLGTDSNIKQLLKSNWLLMDLNLKWKIISQKNDLNLMK